MDREADEDDFNFINPSLIKQLRSILEQYPDDGQILKELLQNAEDAEASEVQFVYDENSHHVPTDQLHHPHMEQFQGPALFAYNNALFKQKDWQGIRMVQDSVKEKDPLKVGRFGLGFKSVFHLTDLPCVMSGEYLAMSDPHSQYFVRGREVATGYRWNLTKRNLSAGHALPFHGICGCTERTFQKGSFNGTIFRFPLRQTASELCETIYDSKRIDKLFQSFVYDAHLLLLFLKNVEHVTLNVRKPGEQRCRLQFEVRINESCLNEVRQKRKQFLSSLKLGEIPESLINVTYVLGIETIDYTSNSKGVFTQYYWLVTECAAGGNISTDFRSLIANPKLGYCPLVGVAMDIAKNTRPSDEPSHEEGDITELTGLPSEMNGQVFCFLPLPIEQKSASGLPVHINGYFSISQNRRHLKWPTSGISMSKGSGPQDKSLLWNQCLLSELVPKAYEIMLTNAISRYSNKHTRIQAEYIMKALPSMNAVNDKWYVILQPLYERLLRQAIFFSESHGGCWLKAQECWFGCKLKDTEPADMVSLLSELLIFVDAPLVTWPKYLLNPIGAFTAIDPIMVSPGLVRTVTKDNKDVLNFFDCDKKLKLLAYCVKDDPYCLEAERYIHHLMKLPLLPLDNGMLIEFSNSHHNTVYIPSKDHPRDLLPGMENHLLASSLNEDLEKKMLEIAQSGTYNLKMLTVDSMCKLIKQLLPTSWTKKPLINLAVETPCALDEEWFNKLWEYLARQVSDQLFTLQGLPILPVSHDPLCLVPLVMPSKVFLASYQGYELSPGVKRLLEQSGCTIVDSLPAPLLHHSHLLGNYVQLPMPFCVVEAVSDIHTSPTYKFTQEEATDILTFFSQLDALTEAQKNYLSILPVFKTFHDELIPLHRGSMSVENSSNLPLEKLKKPIVDLSCSKAKYVAGLMQVNILSSSDLMTHAIMPEITEGAIDEELLESVTTHILKDLTVYSSNALSIIKKTPFIRCIDGSLARPGDLYDPTCDVLLDLFHDKPVFPSQKYRDDLHIAAFRHLGMRSQDAVSALDVLSSAFHIHKQAESGTVTEKFLKMSFALLHTINANPDVLQALQKQKPISCYLRQMDWLPTLQSAPEDGYPKSLKWHESKFVEKPINTCLYEHNCVVGSSMPIVAERIKRSVSDALGMNETLQLNGIVKHLKNIIECYSSSEKEYYLLCIKLLYYEVSQHDAQSYIECLEQNNMKAWLWNGDGFVEPSRVSVEVPFVDLQPYVSHLQTELNGFADFLEECGVRHSCNRKTLIDTLHDISGSKVDVTNDRKLELSVAILNRLADYEFEDDLEDIPVPIQTSNAELFKVLPLKDCTYCDTEWLRIGFSNMEFNEDDDDINFVHPNISMKTAEQLGVRPLISRILHTEQFGLEGFGQQESLTQRLHGLLEGYSDGFAIPKEMIQNAEDARASEVVFIYDERSNTDHMQRLLDENMKQCQGPALWVYNDSIFNDEDFQNLANLGSASKSLDPEKIGQFGLGFNSVYNITDVPSIMSREYLVILDPHFTHLGKAIQHTSKAGIMVNLKKNRALINKMSDQFYPYMQVQGCDLQTKGNVYFDGTLIRLPLRTRNQADRSEISDLHYDQQEMRKLIKIMYSGAESLLLFTTNVKKIRMLHIPRNETDPKNAVELFTITKARKNIVEQSVVSSKEGLWKIVKDAVRTGTPITASTKALYGEILEFEKHFLETASVFLKFQLTDMHTSNFWLVVYSCGQSHALRMAHANPKESFSPCAAAAVQLKFSEDGEAKVVPNFGTLFCYLPLPIVTGLPVHINAAFSVQSDRRDIIRSTTDEKANLKHEWNVALLSDSVCAAYVTLIECLFSISKSNSSAFELWPSTWDKENFSTVTESFYHLIVSLPHFPVSRFQDNTILLNDALFLDPKLTINPVIGQIACQLFKEELPKAAVLDITSSVIEDFNKCGLSKFISSRMYTTVKFYQEVLLPHIETINEGDRNKLLQFALRSQNGELRNVLRDEECIPTSGRTMVLKKPSDLINPDSNMADLFKDDDERFPHEKFRSPPVMAALQDLGMLSSYLHWNDFIDRANAVISLNETQPEQALILLKLLFHCLDYQLQNAALCKLDEMQHCKNVLSKAKFLPLLQKPVACQLPWKNEDHTKNELLAPVEVYHISKMCLISVTKPVIGVRISPKVEEFLGMARDIHWSDVVTQLELMISCEVTDQKAINEVYAFLNKQCESSETVKLGITSFLADKCTVCVDGTYVLPSLVAKNFKYSAKPYLFPLPDDYKMKYGTLMTALGVKENFEALDFVSLLSKVHDEKQDEQLTKHEMEVCVLSLRELAHAVDEQDLVLADVLQDHVIYVPNTRRVLKPSSDLIYNDSMSKMNASSRVRYTYDEIPLKVASQLGISMHRKEMTTKLSTGMPFGQKEPLVNTLKRILKSYPKNVEILKELIQNSDDALATEIKFIKDDRDHRSNYVFAESWKLLQGAALVVYNNSAFTNKDVEAIQRLGDSDKQFDPSKTGQYGIGFNSVYHLTDAPTLYTRCVSDGDKLCVFDPNCCYVPEATSAEPGRRFDGEDLDNVREEFTDVMKAHLTDVIKMGKNSTLFRLPLRSTAMASKSSISQDTVTTTKLDSILDELAENAFDLLLFTNHLRKISICDIDTVSQQVVSRYVVEAKVSPEDEQLCSDFHAFIKKTTKQLINGDISLHQVEKKSISYTLRLMDSRQITELWHICQTVGFEETPKLCDQLEKAIKSGELVLMPRGGVACLLERRKYGQLQTDYRPSKAFSFLPLPLKTGLPVQVNGHFALNFENRHCLATDEVGCAWNNVIFEYILSPLYADMLCELRDQYSDNRCVEDTTYYSCSKKLLDSRLEAIQSFFPNFMCVSSEFQHLAEAFYTYISLHMTPIIPVVGSQCETTGDMTIEKWKVEWLPVAGEGKNKVFFQKSEEKAEDVVQQSGSSLMSRFKSMFSAQKKQEKKKTDHEILTDLLFECGFKVGYAEKHLIDSFHRAGISVDFMSPAGVTDFFLSYSSDAPACHIGNLPVHLSKSVFENMNIYKLVINFCKDDEDFTSKLDGLPLQLSADLKLDVFSAKKPLFVSSCHDLFPKSNASFVHKCLLESVFSSKDIDHVPCVKKCTIEDIAAMLPEDLDENEYKTAESITWKLTSYGTPHKPDIQWLYKLWTCIIEEIKQTLKDTILASSENDMVEAKPRDGFTVEEAVVVTSMLSPLEGWCLIPTVCKHKKYLHAITKSPSIINMKYESLDESAYKAQHVREVFSKLDLFELDVVRLNSAAGTTLLSDFIAKLPCVATLSKATSILLMLSDSIKRSETVKFNITRTEGTNVLRYFSENMDSITSDPDADVYIGMLRNLPFYCTVYDELISIDQCCVYVLPSEIPKREMDVWRSTSGTVFLREHSDLKQLHEVLGCYFMDIASVYCDFILGHFEYLSNDARMEHIEYLYEHYLKVPTGATHLQGDDNERLMNTLKNLQFIEDCNGELHTADEFYDPDNILFRFMLPEEKLPPRTGTTFKESEWYALLRMIGMKSEVTHEMFVDFATSVSVAAKDPKSARAEAQSRKLVEHLVETYDPTNDASLFKDVSEIPFICPKRVNPELSNVCQQYHSYNDEPLPYFALRDSVPHEYTPVAWTSTNILPSWVNIPQQDKEIVYPALHIQQRPEPTMVVRHLNKLVEAIHERPGILESKHIVAIFRSIYSYLQEHCLNDEDCLNALRKMTCVLILEHKVLVQAHCTVQNLAQTEEIKPYLYRITPAFGEYEILFKRLGTTDQVTQNQYAAVLKNISMQSQNASLNPNELRFAFKAISGFFTCGIQGEVNQDLCLLNEAGKLLPVSMLVFNNYPSYYNRLRGCSDMQFMLELKYCGLKSATVDSEIEQLHRMWRPRMLSDVVTEKLAKQSTGDMCSGIAERLRDHLRSDEFSNGIIRLIRHKCFTNNQVFNNDDVINIRDYLGTIEVFSVPNVTTVLTNTTNGKTIRSTELERRCFVTKIQNIHIPQWKVFIRDDAELTMDTLVPVAEVINDMLRRLLGDAVLYLLPILTCDRTDIYAKLDALNVRPDHVSSAQALPAVRLPILGEPVSQVDQVYLTSADDTDGAAAGSGSGRRHQYESGEFVAWAGSDDAVYRYGIVEECIYDDTTAQLIYCRIQGANGISIDVDPDNVRYFKR